jgi:hypothetical protein
MLFQLSEYSIYWPEKYTQKKSPLQFSNIKKMLYNYI